MVDVVESLQEVERSALLLSFVQIPAVQPIFSELSLATCSPHRSLTPHHTSSSVNTRAVNVLYKIVPSPFSNMAASYNFLSSTDSSAGQLGPMPHIAEDTLVYTIHLPPLSSQASSAESVNLANISSEACAAIINDEVQSLLNAGRGEGQSTWIWHKDAWELKVASTTALGALGSSSEGRRSLEGRMRIGDSVDDEWLVVWLLREVSRKWPELIIS